MRIFELEKPITVGERTVQALSLPELADVEAHMILESAERAAAKEQSTILAVLAGLCGEPYKLVRKIAMTDLSKIRPYLDEVMGNAT